MSRRVDLAEAAAPYHEQMGSRVGDSWHGGILACHSGTGGDDTRVMPTARTMRLAGARHEPATDRPTRPGATPLWP